jgi:hypothetical protein
MLQNADLKKMAGAAKYWRFCDTWTREINKNGGNGDNL